MIQEHNGQFTLSATRRDATRLDGPDEFYRAV